MESNSTPRLITTLNVWPKRMFSLAQKLYVYETGFTIVDNNGQTNTFPFSDLTGLYIIGEEIIFNYKGMRYRYFLSNIRSSLRLVPIVQGFLAVKDLATMGKINDMKRHLQSLGIIDAHGKQASH